jgi:hypothetical protein
MNCVPKCLVTAECSSNPAAATSSMSEKSPAASLTPPFRRSNPRFIFLVVEQVRDLLQLTLRDLGVDRRRLDVECRRCT